MRFCQEAINMLPSDKVAFHTNRQLRPHLKCVHVFFSKTYILSFVLSFFPCYDFLAISLL